MCLEGHRHVHVHVLDLIHVGAYLPPKNETRPAIARKVGVLQRGFFVGRTAATMESAPLCSLTAGGAQPLAADAPGLVWRPTCWDECEGWGAFTVALQV